MKKMEQEIIDEEMKLKAKAEKKAKKELKKEKKEKKKDKKKEKKKKEDKNNANNKERPKIESNRFQKKDSRAGHAMGRGNHLTTN